jgi:hypothetical protein
VQIWTHFLDPMRAEVRLSITGEGREIRGRLMGPRCPFASTVEVAYPVRPVGSQGQVIIPEPSLWEPLCPFLYEGPVECWSEGALKEQAWVSHGLRNFFLGPKGFLLNGRPLLLRGTVLDQGRETDLLQLRQQGYNAILAPADQVELWDLASRLGFLMLGRIDEKIASSTSFRHLHSHPPTSSLAWVWSEDFGSSEKGKALGAEVTKTMEPGKQGGYYGLFLPSMPGQQFVMNVSFLVVHETNVEEMRPLKMPMIVLKNKGTPDFQGPNILGWIDRA